MNAVVSPPQLTLRAVLLAIVLAVILAAANTYLGLFAAHDPVIPDPYSMSEADTVRVVDQICASVNAFLATLGRPPLRAGDDPLRVEGGRALPIEAR